MRTEEQIKLVDSDDLHGETYEHPAFGMVTASRVTGRCVLYGSDFAHTSTIRVSIHEGELKRNLSNDWPHAKKQLVEIEMSEAQWASFVSSIGVGSGVQCTLRRFDGKRRADLPEPESRSDQFGKEFNGKVDGVIDAIQSAIDLIESLKVSKKKKAELSEAFEVAIREIKSNMPFVADQFGEHMEGVVEAARAEIHGHMVGVLSRAGMEAIGDKLPLLIEGMEQ